MCTLTWVREPAGYTVCMSRDERRTRHPASAPTEHSIGGVRLLAPLDGERGGSWIAVNQLGLTCCLLNRYQDGSGTAVTGPSRGEIVLWTAVSQSQEDALRRLPDPRRFEPFTLVVIEPGRPTLVLDWTGRRLLTDLAAEARRPLTSSSLCHEEAGAARRELYQRLGGARLKAAGLAEFHASHEPARGALSPCMHREDAATVSFSRIQVLRDTIRFVYQDGPPCGGGRVTETDIPRRTANRARAA